VPAPHRCDTDRSPTIDRTDLSLLLSTLALAVSIGIGPIAVALIAAFAGGLLLGSRARHRQ
jgi:hypothetical protein